MVNVKGIAGVKKLNEMHEYDSFYFKNREMTKKCLSYPRNVDFRFSVATQMFCVQGNALTKS